MSTQRHTKQKNKTQKTKNMSNSDTFQTPGWEKVIAKNKRFQLLIGQPPFILTNNWINDVYIFHLIIIRYIDYQETSMIQGIWCTSIGMQGESLFNIYSIIFVSSFDKLRYYELASWSHFQWHIFNISDYCTLLQKKRCGTYIATQHV
jgi:hypothetical protein